MSPTKTKIATNQQPDEYGQIHVAETLELVQTSLAQFDQAEAAIVAKKHSTPTALQQAHSQCPHLLTNDFKLKFLRAEVFNVKLALKRYDNYWHQRLVLFGPVKAFQDMILSQALDNDHESLAIGVARYVGKHPSGRAIVLLDPSRVDGVAYDRDSLIRAIWYTFHAAIEPTDAQKRGIIVIWRLSGFHMGLMDRKFVRKLAKCIQGAIPVRLAAIHICDPPFIFKIVMPIIKVLLIKRVRRRLKFHFGPAGSEKMMGQLERYGLGKDVVPTELGGTVVLCHTEWLRKRAAEGK